MARFVAVVQEMRRDHGGIVPRSEFERRTAAALEWKQGRLGRAVQELHEHSVLVLLRNQGSGGSGAADEHIVLQPQVLADMLARVITAFSPLGHPASERECSVGG